MSPIHTRLPVIILMSGLLAACGRGGSDTPASPQETDRHAETTASAASAEGNSSADAHHEEQQPGHAEEHHDHRHDGTAGGTAHVHGVADLSLVRDGARYEAVLVTPLANFGLAEADGAFSDAVIRELPRLVELTGGDCIAATPLAEVDTSSEHTDGHVHLAWDCASPDAVTALRFAGFDAFPGFESVNAVFMADSGQKAVALTPSAPQLGLR